MPLRDFRCRACGATFEELIRTAEDERTASCPKCGQKKPERLLSAPSLGGSAKSAGGSGGGCVSRGGFS